MATTDDATYSSRRAHGKGNLSRNNLQWHSLRPIKQMASLSKPDIERVQALADISRSALCCRSNETRAPSANPHNSAQLDGTPYHSSKLHPGPCKIAWKCGEGQTHTDTQTRVNNIHFASATPHAKCN